MSRKVFWGATWPLRTGILLLWPLSSKTLQDFNSTLFLPQSRTHAGTKFNCGQSGPRSWQQLQMNEGPRTRFHTGGLSLQPGGVGHPQVMCPPPLMDAARRRAHQSAGGGEDGEPCLSARFSACLFPLQLRGSDSEKKGWKQLREAGPVTDRVLLFCRARCPAPRLTLCS